MKPNCIFCKIIAKLIPSKVILENETLIVIEDIAPKAPLHLLIIPKKHIENVDDLKESDKNMLFQMFKAAQDLKTLLPNAKDYKLVINNGAGAGQKVFHLHMHVLAGKISSLEL